MISEMEAYLVPLWHAASGALVLAALWWLAFCAVVAWLAKEKGHNGLGFFLIALVFSPLTGLLAVIAARDLKAAADARAANDTVREMISPLALHIDGIRGHLAVSKESVRPPTPQAPPLSPSPRTATIVAP